MKKLRHVLLLLMAFAAFTTASAQKQTVKGTVVDSQGEPVIGATVKEQGSQTGTVTDLDGNFTLQTKTGATISISYIGYVSQDVKATPNMHIVLKDDSHQLEDVVVVGYGVQKKSVVTASIAKVSADDLAKTAPVRMDNALKGLAAGVNVTSSSGAPGAGSKVQVRGIGTINNSDPLYIVDGMPIESGIDYLNPSDIESIEVLKDAASGAVYGARAANGVILVTTKMGKQGKVSVNYNASFGWQSKWRKRDVLNAREYMTMMNEGYVNSGAAPVYTPDQIANPKYDTNWQDEIFNDNAPVSNHEVNISGANDKINYYLSLGYFSQDGIVGGDKGRSNYRRLTLRSNTNYTIFDDTKERTWLNKLTISANLSYSRIKSIGFTENAWANSMLGSTLTLAPTFPVYYSGAEATAKQAEYAANFTNYVPQYDGNGNLFMIPGADYDTQYNPVAYLALPGSWGWTNKYVANFAANLEIGYGFKYRISYGADVNYNGVDRGYTIPYYLNGGMNASKSSANASSNRSTVWQIENVITWDGTFDKHTINVVLGQSAKKTTGYSLGGSKNYLVDPAKPYIDYATGHLEGDLSVYAGPWDNSSLASLFARASYNYDERYMAQFTVRRDGSSRFGSNNHYATFPSFSLGWNVMNEKFMENTRDWLSNLKVRFSWGKNGNENIGNFRYAVYSRAGYDVIFGHGAGNKNLGVRAGGLANPDLQWEESVQTDLGLDLGFFNNALTFTVDYFSKKTKGMLMDIPIPAYVGDVRPVGNVGEMKNSGVEFELGYKWRIADAKFAVKGNLSYLKNELVNLGNDSGEKAYDSMQGIGTITYAKNGEPFPFFYGYKTAGIFQNEGEVQSYKNAAGTLIQPNAQPGDLRFVDIDGDGKITDKDQTKIGKGTPDWTFGLNVNAEWKGIDFNMFWQGTAGNDIYDATMRVDRRNLNLPSWMLDRWTGEGTSNEIPRFVIGNNSNLVSSDLYVHSGSYLRLKNISLGYTLPQDITKRFFVSNLRVYVMAENLLTFTKYHGYDPEISAGATSLGVDYGVYPQARTWTIGFNLGF